MKIQINEDKSVVVRSRHSDWMDAARILSRHREFPPDGYRLVRAEVKRRSKTGRSANLSMTFEHCCEDVDPFDTEEAFEHFGWIEN